MWCPGSHWHLVASQQSVGLQVYMHYPFEREVASTVPRTAYEDRKFGECCSKLRAAVAPQRLPNSFAP